ncbi:MAG: hypothetical protein ACKO1O_05390 [Erythrobacter sp.]
MMPDASPVDLPAALGMPVFDVGPLAALYRPMEAGAWRLTVGGSVLCPGYPDGVKLVQGVIALVRGNETWMSLTPIECESQILGVAAAEGHVVIMGLGMGWVAAETALRAEVLQVTIVERDPDVIAIHRALDLFAQLPGGAGEKVRIVEASAYDWRPDQPVDLLMPDIWLGLIEGDRVPEVRRMQDNVGARAIYFWGQELEIARHAAAAGRRLDAAGVAATVRDFALPLVMPEDIDYPTFVQAAARQWMRGRWFAPEHAAILEPAPPA